MFIVHQQKRFASRVPLFAESLADQRFEQQAVCSIPTAISSVIEREIAEERKQLLATRNFGCAANVRHGMNLNQASVDATGFHEQRPAGWGL
jgi:hypothetical protein